MTNAELREILVNSGIDPGPEHSQYSPMLSAHPDWDYELEDYVPEDDST